jgi:hypothetical protein
MAPEAPPSRPHDLFHIDDHIQVIYTKSKHYQRTGIVTRVCNPRLSVRFDDGRPGNYVDYRYARLIPETNTTPRHSDLTGGDWVTAVSDDRGDDETDSIVALMEDLAIQTAVTTLAVSNNMTDVERAINEQAARIRIQARRILQRRNNNEDT